MENNNYSPLEGKPDIDYPCSWQYKVIGTDRSQVEKAIRDICSPIPVEINYSHSSSSGKYISLNVEIEVQDEEARNSLYRSLQDHPAIKMVI